MYTVRDLSPDDHSQVVALNEASVELLAPMDEAKLVEILASSSQALVVDAGDGEVAAFLLLVSGRADYDSDNYAWFERYVAEQGWADHTYVDRIVVSADHRRQGLASLLYDEAEKTPPVTLEVYVDPPNEPSLAYHRNRGYTQIGTMPQPSGKTCGMFVRL